MTARDAWEPIACILGVISIANPPIAPEIAKLTGLSLDAVCEALVGMEREGMVRRTGRHAAGWNGGTFDVWERIIKPP